MNGGRGVIAHPPALVSEMAEEFLRAAEVATGQHGAITARQFGDAGVSSGQLRRQVQSGVLERSGSHTHRSPFVPRSALAEVAAVVLDCGPDCVASGPTAAALHGFDGMALRRPYHVTVVRGRNVATAGWSDASSSCVPRPGCPDRRPRWCSVGPAAEPCASTVDSQGPRSWLRCFGYRWHRTKDQMARDAERLNALLLDGLLPMQFTYDQVTIQPAEVLATLRHALAIAA